MNVACVESVYLTAGIKACRLGQSPRGQSPKIHHLLSHSQSVDSHTLQSYWLPASNYVGPITLFSFHPEFFDWWINRQNMVAIAAKEITQIAWLFPKSQSATNYDRFLCCLDSVSSRPYAVLIGVQYLIIQHDQSYSVNVYSLWNQCTASKWVPIAAQHSSDKALTMDHVQSLWLYCILCVLRKSSSFILSIVNHKTAMLWTSSGTFSPPLNIGSSWTMDTTDLQIAFHKSVNEPRHEILPSLWKQYPDTVGNHITAPVTH